MEYSDARMVNTFIERTKTNLDLISHWDAPKTGKYEVTQAVNSLFGLLIVPVERIGDRNMKEQLDDRIKRFFKIESRDENANLLAQIRNCLAHGNIGFRAREPDCKQIGFMHLGYINPQKSQIKAEISVEDLFRLTDALFELLKDHSYT